MDSKQLQEAAAKGYQAFCESARSYLPSLYIPDWSRLPQVLQSAWLAAAKTIAEFLSCRG